MSVVFSRKTGAAPRPVPVVLGLRPDVVDYRLARAPPSASSTTSRPDG